MRRLVKEAQVPPASSASGGGSNSGKGKIKATVAKPNKAGDMPNPKSKASMPKKGKA